MTLFYSLHDTTPFEIRQLQDYSTALPYRTVLRTSPRALGAYLIYIMYIISTVRTRYAPKSTTKSAQK